MNWLRLNSCVRLCFGSGCLRHLCHRFLQSPYILQDGRSLRLHAHLSCFILILLLCLIPYRTLILWTHRGLSCDFQAKRNFSTGAERRCSTGFDPFPRSNSVSNPLELLPANIGWLSITDNFCPCHKERKLRRSYINVRHTTLMFPV